MGDNDKDLLQTGYHLLGNLSDRLQNNNYYYGGFHE